MGRIFIACIMGAFALSNAGCAYVQFERKYELAGYEQRKLDDVENALQEFFSSHNAPLKRRIVELYPIPSVHLEFEVPTTPEVQRRRAQILVTIRPSAVSIVQEEWFRSPGAHPQDYLKAVSVELEQKLQRQFGAAVTIKFVSQSYY